MLLEGLFKKVVVLVRGFWLVVVVWMMKLRKVIMVSWECFILVNCSFSFLLGFDVNLSGLKYCLFGYSFFFGLSFVFFWNFMYFISSIFIYINVVKENGSFCFRYDVFFINFICKCNVFISIRVVRRWKWVWEWVREWWLCGI